jgi:hypothetical protein
LRGTGVVDCKGGDSGSRAVVDDIESSTSDLAPASGDVSLIESRDSVRLELFDLIFCVILDCENGGFDGRDGWVNSSIVALIALVISALEVYGKQIFRTALRIMSVLPMRTNAVIVLTPCCAWSFQ